jgi:hypothetical protein
MSDQHDLFLRELAEERESLGDLFGVRGEYMRVDSRFDPTDDELPISSYMEVDPQRWARQSTSMPTAGWKLSTNRNWRRSFLPESRRPSPSTKIRPSTRKPITRDEFEEAQSAVRAGPD